MAQLPGPRCGKMVDHGLVAYPCRDDEGHDGPCYAIEVPRTVEARKRWEEAQAERQKPETAPPAEMAPAPSHRHEVSDELSPLDHSQGLRQRPGDQPLPIPNDLPTMQSLVMADIAEREQLGISRYGVGLQGHNGRDALRDLYEELLDACMYLRQVMWERDNPLPIDNGETS